MKGIHIFSLLIIYMLLSCFIECRKKSPNLKEKKRLNKSRINARKRNNTTKPKYRNKRKNEEDEEPKGRLNTSFVPLKIYLDLYNLNYTFPNETFGESTKEIFVEAINRAKNILESYLYIEIDYDYHITMVNNYIESEYQINYYNKSIINTTLHNYNFFILFDFVEEEGEPSVNYEIIFDDAAETTAGLIYINTYMESRGYSNVNYLTNLMLHEFIHLLGFDSVVLFQKDLTSRYPSTITKEKFPNLFKYAENYFNCTLEEIEVESYDNEKNDNIHFSSRLLLGELMTSFNYPEEQILSGFTLAFLDDLPYIRVVKNYTGGLMRFGKHKGTNFINNHCINGFQKNEITFANEFYFINNLQEIPETYEPSCSSGRLSKTVHKVYNEDDELVGPEKTDSCPISEFDEVNSGDIYIGHCNQENSAIDDNELQNIIKESFTNNSFCVLSSLVPNENQDKSKIRAVCYEMYCSPLSLTIRIGDNYLVCPRSGGKIKAEDLYGYLLCPDYNLICTGKNICNSNYDCFIKKSEEKLETLIYNYTIKTTQNSEVYINEESIYGYELAQNGHCPFMCSQCDANGICKKCAPHYKPDENNNKICIEKDPNCESYDSEETDICSHCKSGYSLAKEDDGTFMCVESSNNHYFSILDDSIEPNLSYLIRCNNGVTNCDTCESSNKCTKCLNDENYKLVDNGAFCEELSSKKIYWDESLEQYKYCTYKDPKCSKCQSSLDSNEKFVCEKCEELYALKHDNNNEIQCSLKTDLDSNSEYYTNDSGINYYSCSNSLFNDVSNCKECSNKNSCNRCQESYKLVNDNKDCMLQSDIDDNIIYYNPNTNIYTPCSELISLCYKCNSETTCTDCGEEGQLEENDSCISNELVENHNYFKDETINKYVSCSIIENCVTCTSSTICISCKDGYNVNNNICQIISSDEDKKLTTGAIIGIVFGCLGFLLVVAGVVYYLMNKVLKKKEINTIEPEEKIEAKEYREKTEEVVKTTKRSIHNVENK